MLKQPRYVIAVKDLAKSSLFYRDKLGFEVIEIEDKGWRFFVRDNVTIMAGDCPDEMAASETGDHSYMAYIVADNVDALFAEYEANGVEIIKPLRDEAHGMREFGIRTLDGHRLIFGQSISA
jgi:catechol 2,3-dioxygenase-like lactoylglutathione lyase family enzyme